MNKKYKLRYLPLFYDDLAEAVKYILVDLSNPQAARRLVDKTEEAILKRLDFPKSIEPFKSEKERENCYYRIIVNNYSVFYVVIDDVMEVRRFLYNGRDIRNIL